MTAESKKYRRDFHEKEKLRMVNLDGQSYQQTGVNI